MKRTALSSVLALIGVIALSLAASAQTGTPAPAPGCTVEPRSAEEIDRLAALAATPVATQADSAAVTLPEGDPVDPATIDALLATLNEADACAAAGDLARLLALYTDRFVVASVFAPESAAILTGEPPVDFSTPATPVAVDRRPVILAARLLDDGRVATQVSPLEFPTDQQIVWFVQSGDRWLIDDIQPGGALLGTPVAIPGDAATIVEAVIAAAASVLQVPPEEIEVTFIESIEWPDSALGCPEEGGVYAQVVTPGYLILVSDGASTLEYHTDLQGNFVQC